tara:strand:+ start:182 stop:295 length:114 start_codon:yes stop_codon:yes gene_type:complete
MNDLKNYLKVVQRIWQLRKRYWWSKKKSWPKPGFLRQ